MQKTENELIHIGKPIPFDVEEFLGQLEMLAEACYGNSSEIKTIVASVVTTYHSSEDDLAERRGMFAELFREAAATVE